MSEISLRRCRAGGIAGDWEEITACQGWELLCLESMKPAPGRACLVSAKVESERSSLLWEVWAYASVGLDGVVGGDRAFK